MRDVDVVRAVVVAILAAFAGIAIIAGLGWTGVISSRPSPTPTPTRDPGAFFTVQGNVFDEENQKPLAGVCVVIGPRSCQPNMAHTDSSGHFLVELPRTVTIAYDFHFVKDGYQQVDYHFVVVDDLNMPVRMRPTR